MVKFWLETLLLLLLYTKTYQPPGSLFKSRPTLNREKREKP
jgi:hypothetical protein